jgi:hypothetical protein
MTKHTELSRCHYLYLDSEGSVGSWIDGGGDGDFELCDDMLP